MYQHLLVALEVARFLRAPQHRQQQFAIELGVARRRSLGDCRRAAGWR
jgi:hypothetical protein